jgi:hypothetical protein
MKTALEMGLQDCRVNSISLQNSEVPEMFLLLILNTFCSNEDEQTYLTT